jgi:hypothetical protein
MIAVPAMFRNGMMPVRLKNRIMKKIVVRIGRNRWPSFLPRRSSAMLTGRSRGPSRRSLEPAGDETHVARAEPEEEHERDRRQELDQVDARDGDSRDREENVREELVDRRAVESPPSSAVLAIRVAAWVNSAGSSFGAPAEPGDDGR